MKINELKQRLSEGFHLVEFTKKSGERVARVLTLDPTLIPEFEAKTDRVTKQNAGVVRAWDVDRKKYCSVIPANVHSTN